MLELSVSPLLRTTIDSLSVAQLGEKSASKLGEWKQATKISLEDVELILSAVRKAKKCSDRDGPWLHQLLAESSIVFESPVKKEKSPELQERLAKLQAKLEDRQYAEMVADVTEVERSEKARQEDREMLSNSGEGVGIIVTMFTGFVFCFMLAKQGSDKPIVHLSAGLFGMIVMLVIQAFLFVIKSHRGISTAEKNKKKQGAFAGKRGSSSASYRLSTPDFSKLAPPPKGSGESTPSASVPVPVALTSSASSPAPKKKNSRRKKDD